MKCLGPILYDDYFSNNGSGLIFKWKRAGGEGGLVVLFYTTATFLRMGLVWSSSGKKREGGAWVSVLCDDVLTIGLFSSSYEKMDVFSFYILQSRKKSLFRIHAEKGGGRGL
jgi:hypothetical protein